MLYFCDIFLLSTCMLAGYPNQKQDPDIEKMCAPSTLIDLSQAKMLSDSISTCLLFHKHIM